MKLIGITQYAYDHLSLTDIYDLEQMIGSEVNESLEDDLYIMADGEVCHSDFLIIEP